MIETRNDGYRRLKHPFKLDKQKIDRIFEEAEHQAEYLYKIYLLVYPNYEDIKEIEQYPQINDRTNHYIWTKAVEFDKENHPEVMAGGAWFNRGFSVNANMEDWEVLQAWYILPSYPRYDTDTEEKCPHCRAFLTIKIELSEEGKEYLADSFCPQECQDV